MDKRYQTNQFIRADKLQVIDGNQNLGVISKDQALAKARERGLDLVLIGPMANPPVAKILDFTKFLYEEKKKKSGQKARRSQVKELKISAQIDDRDLEIKVKRIKEILEDGDKLRANVVLRGRENIFAQFAYERLNKLKESLADCAKTEEPEPKRMGNSVFVTFVKK